MKRIALLGALVVLGCAPSIEQKPSSAHTIIEFDPAASPAVVPLPNDLAINPATGKVNAPLTGTPANQEFTKDFLNTLDGFPVATPAIATASDPLDASSVSAATVLVNDLTVAAGGGNPQVAVTPVFDPSTNSIVVQPPNGAWTKGHDYEVVILGGPNGVKDANGGTVYGSATFALARSATPVVTCAGSTLDSSCRSNTNLVPDDAQATQLEQLRQGYAPLFTALEGAGITRDNVASLWTFKIVSQAELTFDPLNSVIPFPNDLATKPLSDGGVQLNLPYPASALLPDGGPDLTNPQAQLVFGLNTLNGFSTTAPIVTENSDSLPALTDGAHVDPASLAAAGAVNVVELVNGAGSNHSAPEFIACLNCASSNALTPLPDGGISPQPDGGFPPEQLQIVPTAPLDESSRFAAYVSTDVKSTDGKNVAASPTFALFRMSNPLVDSGGHSTVQGVSDQQAQGAEPIRQALKPAFDALEGAGVPRSKIALGWVFDTQSTQSVLNQIHAAPAAASVPTAPWNVSAPAALQPAAPPAFPHANLSAVFSGEYASPFLLTGTGGTINPATTYVQTVNFFVALPSSAAPSTGYPVVIFGHGFQGNHSQLFALADTFAAQGFASIAIDENFHGDRTSCTGSGPVIAAQGIPGATDDYACGGPGNAPNPVAQKCDEKLPIGHCVNRTTAGNACAYLSPGSSAGTGGDAYCASVGQGICLPTANGQPGVSTCANGDFWRVPTGGISGSTPDATWAPVISGWNIFNVSNLFATRDNLRQQVADDAQLARVVMDTTPITGAAPGLNAQLMFAIEGAGGTQPILDTSGVHYVGQSLGGILGTLYVASSPEVHTGVLNVPAGDLIRIFLTSPNATLSALRAGFIGQLQAQGIQPNTPAFDDFIGLAKMILDPADPLNSGFALTHNQGTPTDRHTFFQFIENDQFLPNPTTLELVNSNLRGGGTCALGAPAPCADVYEFTDAVWGSAMPANNSRHGFLTAAPGSNVVSDAGKTQVENYLATPGTINPVGP
jgi:hypothetical protein